MQEHEACTGLHYETIVTHDAEDVVHPQSLLLINWFASEFAMVQIPVLALPTPAREFTHGLYCDEFAEYQSKDIPVRQALGGFLPSNGVGCGFDRRALEHLARSRDGRIFDPVALTEDYENGMQLHALGYRQIFVPIHFEAGAPIATREYFPRRRAAAARQRSRWIAGIALQGWQRHAWRVPWPQRYWLWRDRKGLLGNLLSPLANLSCALGIARWRDLAAARPWLGALYACTLFIALLQIGMRLYAARRIYGWKFAALSPLRAVWGNAINFQATLRALSQFAAARFHGAALRWQKTEHHFPLHSSSSAGRPRLGEVLVGMRRIQLSDVDSALRCLPSGARLGEHLVQLGKVSERDLYQALSAQAGIPLGAPAQDDVNRLAARALPTELARRWRVLPYRIVMGQLHLVTTESPCDQMIRELGQATALHLRFRLAQPGDFRKLAELVDT
jgi:adsorption protein B